MDQLGTTSNAALLASLLLLLSMLWMRRRQAKSPRPRAGDGLDTVQSWPAQLVPVMTPLQRRAHALLSQALPGHLVLVQTPLAQFMRVSTRNSYVEWHKRAGRLRASFLVCDEESNVIAAVDLRLSHESAREQSRHTRLVRVLESVGVTVMVWNEGALPSASQVRDRFAPLLSRQEQPGRAARAAVLEPGVRMSGALEAMSVEATDFAGLETLPAPLDERDSGSPRSADRRRSSSSSYSAF